MNLTKNNMEAMENEFIFTAAFAVVWLILSLAMLATAIYSKRKRFESAQDWCKVQDVLFLIRFLWLLFGVAMIVAFGIEMTIKLI